MAREIAGPAIVLAMLLAGVVAMLSSLCYAEFAARIPKTGSAYLFGYVCSTFSSSLRFPFCVSYSCKITADVCWNLKFQCRFLLQVTMGEFVAFVIAWQMVLENMIGNFSTP